MRRINDTPRLSNLHRECRGAPGQPPGVHREVRNMRRATSPPDVAYKQASRKPRTAPWWHHQMVEGRPTAVVDHCFALVAAYVSRERNP